MAEHFHLLITEPEVGDPWQAAEKVVSERKQCPQRLKPDSEQCTYRSAEALRHPRGEVLPD
jgi:hypothetical protein